MFALRSTEQDTMFHNRSVAELTIASGFQPGIVVLNHQLAKFLIIAQATSSAFNGGSRKFSNSAILSVTRDCLSFF